MTGMFIIQSSNQLEEVLDQSHLKPLFLYKHSTNCGSSRVAHTVIHQFIMDQKHIADHFLFAMIRVIEEKALSMQAASLLHIPHLSPQVMLIVDRSCLWHVSHQHINTPNLHNTAVHYLLHGKKQ
ncbi:bacillithiol system redox-active protein YtxJ [Paenibacillus marinisediminis]